MSDTPRTKKRKVDYHYCPDCGYRMTDICFMAIIADVPCPGRGGVPCGKPISRFHTAYKRPEPLAAPGGEEVQGE